MPLRLAILSFWHVHARDYARQASEHPGTEITAVWDEDAVRGRAWAGDLGARFHPDLGGLLARDDVDAVVVTCPTTAHRQVITAAAAAGKHIFTEKVLAPTPAECAEIIAAADRSGVALMLALPRLYEGYTTAIRKVLADGELGRLTLVRVRLSHGGSVGEGTLPEHFYDPAATAGGALVDLGCHPMYLARLFLGRMPETVTASFGHVTERAVEDNAVVVLRCADGALGVVEASFTAPASPFSIELHGSGGSLVYGTPEPKLLLGTAGAWRELPVPPRTGTPFDLFVRHVADGTRDEENLALGLDLTRLTAAATRGSREEGTRL
ncbi:Gfo/Idh/MocA family oxidoreductase [Actinoallomurus bryophytorum]|uniref:Putative dehydrogenase n=1 Tax=Actinoallomurus bryophytorum TaxID=1490222 RepID=A0A543CUH9_9ACTN|nr:Gfo/Idh/MocA family oxidoreductase [Actinoallomurus bryophytorum]TQM00772.1 putative dehydrogenase [Actinoallomurus bryophytorum]